MLSLVTLLVATWIAATLLAALPVAAVAIIKARRARSRPPTLAAAEALHDRSVRYGKTIVQIQSRWGVRFTVITLAVAVLAAIAWQWAVTSGVFVTNATLLHTTPLFALCGALVAHYFLLVVPLLLRIAQLGNLTAANRAATAQP